MSRVFLDTNVLISATLGHGLCADLFDIIVQDHQLVLGEPVIDEFERILRDKFKIPASLRQELVIRLKSEAEMIAATGELPITSPDPNDIDVLQSAQSAHVHWLATGDKPLLRLKHLGELPIVSPRQLWDLLESQGTSD